MNSKTNFLKKHLFEIITILFWIWIVVYYFHYKYIHNYSNEHIIKNLYFFLKREWIYGWLFFVSIYILRTIIFFPSSLLIIISPSLFWIPLAILYSVLGENLSAVFGYLLGKIFWKRILPETFFDKFKFLKKNLKDSPFLWVLTSRLVFIPFDPFNYFCWIINIKFWPYILATILWTFSNLLIFIFIWSWIKNVQRFSFKNIELDYKYMLFSTIITIVSLLLAFYFRIHSKNKEDLKDLLENNII